MLFNVFSVVYVTVAGLILIVFGLGVILGLAGPCRSPLRFRRRLHGPKRGRWHRMGFRR